MSQLNFFLSEDEVRQRIEELIISSEFTIFSGKFFKTKEPNPILNIARLRKFKDLTIWINNKNRDPICSEKGYKNQFLFDLYQDPVIEIDNCKIKGKLISPGRVYYKAGWIKDANLRKLHQKMARKVRILFNKGLTTISPPFKISDEIKEMVFKGYILELGEGGMKITSKNIKIEK